MESVGEDTEISEIVRLEKLWIYSQVRFISDVRWEGIVRKRLLLGDLRVRVGMLKNENNTFGR